MSDSLHLNGPHEDNSGSIKTAGPFQKHTHQKYPVTKEKKSGLISWYPQEEETQSGMIILFPLIHGSFKLGDYNFILN